MAKYRKKPVVIEAVQFIDRPESIGELADFVNESCELKNAKDSKGYDIAELHIKTLEGVMIARDGDWVIKGIKGEFYPCKPDIFEATYEPV